MLKKIAKLACLSCIALSGTLVADQSMQTSGAQGPEIYDGGFTLGSNLETSGSGSAAFLTLGYIDHYFLFDVGFNYGSHNESGPNENHFGFKSHLGLRNQLYQNLFITYGVTGFVATTGNDSDAKTPYSIGAFTGLDLQVSKHFLISAKIDPYKYQSTEAGETFNNVFRTASIGLSYVF